MRRCVRSILPISVWFLSSACSSTRVGSDPVDAASAPLYASELQVKAIQRYIHDTWSELERSNKDLYRAAVDPKSPQKDGKWPVYVSAREDLPGVRSQMESLLSPDDFRRLDFRQLTSAQPDPGILYLPHPYVVPGGRFNEMYGWDSYFIVRGLLRDGRIAQAQAMAENLLYEVKHYGSVLNANRSYYLSRSQPPLLTQTVLEVYAHTHNREFLATAVEQMDAYYHFWMTVPHTTPTGLARYYDVGQGPAPEVVSGEFDEQGQGAYARVTDYYLTHSVTDYDIRRYFDPHTQQLSEAFFHGDRSMRESGFDPTNRFGPFSVAIIDYNPVCLNSLLYVMEQDLAQIHTLLAQPQQAAQYTAASSRRAELVRKLMWDETTGLFLDYDFAQGHRRNYPFATTFYPLWAGIATNEQARRVAQNMGVFAAPGGLKTSPFVTGNQWDSPYGFAPLQLLAVEGLRRYGYDDRADRVSINFLSMILHDFSRKHGIFEKYDVEARRSDVGEALVFGYTSNEVGFGWTNAVFAELFAALSESNKVAIRSPHAMSYAVNVKRSFGSDPRGIISKTP